MAPALFPSNSQKIPCSEGISPRRLPGFRRADERSVIRRICPKWRKCGGRRFAFPPYAPDSSGVGNMSRKDFLCSVTAKDREGKTRKFQIYKLRGEAFEIHDDRGFNHPSFGGQRVNESDIRQELMNAYGADDIVIDGSIEAGKLAASWPRNCQRCSNCECEPTRRRYGRRHNGQGYCMDCLSALKRKDVALQCDPSQPNTWT
jgi:hypothetical protein